jgi:hypothetical protein
MILSSAKVSVASAYVHHMHYIITKYSVVLKMVVYFKPFTCSIANSCHFCLLSGVVCCIGCSLLALRCNTSYTVN